MPGACELAEWNVPHAPNEHRSLLVEIDGSGEKRLAARKSDLRQLFYGSWDEVLRLKSSLA